MPTPIGSNNLALIVSAVVGLAMLWSKFAEIAVNKKNKAEIDRTTIQSKEIDDDIAYRKDLVDENKTLRAELRQANTSFTDAVSKILPKLEEIIVSLGKRAEEHNKILEKLGQIEHH